MTFKSSPRAAAAASALCAMLALAPGPLFGQSPSPTPNPAAKARPGNLRLWNMQPVGSPVLEMIQVGVDPQGRALETAPPQNFFTGYVQLPPGTYTVKVCRIGQRDLPIKSFAVTLRRNSYVTLLASQSPGGQVTAELIDDTPDPTKSPTNRLTVRQFCPNVRAQVTAAGRLHTDMLDVGGVQTLEGLPGGMVPLAMRATLANGSVKTWNPEADFRTSRHASVLVFMDPYGRIRPRVTVDGPSPADEDAAAAEAAGPAHTP